MKQIDERAFQITLELAKSKKGREETEERYSIELNDLLEKVEVQLDSERKVREDNS